MGFLFRKSLSLGRGVRVNISKRGFSSVSVGQRDATVNVSRRGVRETVGLPGTGLSYTTGARSGPLFAIIALVSLIISAIFKLISNSMSLLRKL